ncbi:hypothetical protein N656DRAFT_805938 [Canariomyces notabilis]|uniref:RlpA-like protein double-psi beta-barrel domain-containing protein n=1 Tax=Canariomyces notabilis TaxID=2074819 RepID=A0AAN6TDP4_9PEZI|nr:hypothetical protein N656DRAFT_805938 [Canariomyces arenarius]
MLANIISVALPIMATAKASPIGTMPDTKEVNSTTLETPDVKAAAGYSGRFTHYAPGLGACGQYHSGADWIVALSHIIFDPNTPNGNPNNNALCGRRLRAWYGGKQVDFTVVDRCEACGEHDMI